MSNQNRRKKKHNTKTDGWQITDKILTGAMAVFSSIWIFLILVVMPFYNQEGYAHIGSDKSYLLRSSGVRLGKVMLPVFLLWLACRIVCMVRQRRLNGKKLFQAQAKDSRRLSVVDLFAILYAFSVLLSYLFSDYPETALWGTKGWYMGAIPQLIFVVSYFVLSRFEFAQCCRWFLFASFPVSAVTFVLGYLNRFDIWPLKMESSGLPDYISTVGNINWYCSYVVIILFVAVGFFWRDQGENRTRTILWMVYLAIGFGALITQGSDSGIFAMFCVFCFLFLRSVFPTDSMRLFRFWQTVLLLAGAGIFTWLVCLLYPGKMNYTSELGRLFYGPFSLVLLAVALGALYYLKYAGRKEHQNRETGGRLHAIGRLHWAAKAVAVAVPLVLILFILLIGINTKYPGSIGPLSDYSIFTFDYRWGSRRGATWILGIQCFSGQNFLHKLFGVGPDCMAEYLYSDEGVARGLADVASTVFEGRRLTNAHCEMLTVLVNLGVLGAVSYMGMLVAFLKKGLFENLDAKKTETVACALGVLALLCNNLWSFQQSIGMATMFVILALGMYSCGERD